MKKADKILSIVIPTYNRADMLMYLLPFFEEQIKRNENRVELIVCNNASTDNTKDILLEYQMSHPCIKVVNYTEHVEVGYSIVRSIENATGDFFLVYGDDDIPAPYMIDVLVDTIGKYLDISYIGFNRMKGKPAQNSFGICDITIAGQNEIERYVKVYDDINGYAEEHQNEVGFLSVNIVRRDLWQERYKDVYPNNHRGYEFILPYLYSAKGHRCVYIQYPLCVQRIVASNGKKGQHEWANGLLYFYLGRPRAIFAQEKYGIIQGALELYKNYEVQFGRKYLLEQLLTIPDEEQEIHSSINEICSYLSDDLEKGMVLHILSAKGLTKDVYKVYYKVKIYGKSYFLSKIKKIFKRRVLNSV